MIRWEPRNNSAYHRMSLVSTFSFLTFGCSCCKIVQISYTFVSCCLFFYWNFISMEKLLLLHKYRVARRFLGISIKKVCFCFRVSNIHFTTNTRFGLLFFCHFFPTTRGTVITNFVRYKYRCFHFAHGVNLELVLRVNYFITFFKYDISGKLNWRILSSNQWRIESK